MPSATWGVVATVNEPALLLVAFCAHYLKLGADRITLFFDAPNPEAFEALKDTPNVEIIHCTDDYWYAALGKRPVSAPRRQKINLNIAYARAATEWIAHFDADEFLASPKNVSMRLGGFDTHIDNISVRVAERVHSGSVDTSNVFSGLFRSPCKDEMREDVAEIDGAGAPFLDRGLTSYTGIKSFFRTQRKLNLAIHGPQKGTTNQKAPAPDMTICHFDGLTPTQWIQKKWRTIDQGMNINNYARPERAAQFKAVAASDRKDNARMLEIYAQAKVLSPERESRLRGLDLIKDMDLEIEASVQSVFPDTQFNFTAEAYDKAKTAMSRT